MLPVRYTNAVDYTGMYQTRLVFDHEPSAACNLRPYCTGTEEKAHNNESRR